MADVHFYETTVNWKEGRIGTLSSEGMPDITVATPPQFPKGVPNIWSPEHLLLASVNVCVMVTFAAIADNSNFPFISYSATAKAKLEKVEGRYMISEVEISPEIVVHDEKDKEKAQRIIEKSEKSCLISNSIKAKVSLNPVIKTA